jgi:hypothetical protein
VVVCALRSKKYSEAVIIPCHFHYSSGFAPTAKYSDSPKQVVGMPLCCS